MLVILDSLDSLDGLPSTYLLAWHPGFLARRASARGRDLWFTRTGRGQPGRIRPITRRRLDVPGGGIPPARPCSAIVLDERGTGGRRADGELLLPRAQVAGPLELLRALVRPDTLELVVSPDGRGTEEKQRRKAETREETLPSSRPTCPSAQQSGSSYASEFARATAKADARTLGWSNTPKPVPWVS
jgi:hypothetical protein